MKTEIDAKTAERKLLSTKIKGKIFEKVIKKGSENTPFLNLYDKYYSTIQMLCNRFA
ncbi:MAG: hypothetical protein ACIAQZ_04340 [Sedimentisphaeraceae bacterium JB056]